MAARAPVPVFEPTLTVLIAAAVTGALRGSDPPAAVDALPVTSESATAKVAEQQFPKRPRPGRISIDRESIG